MKSQVARLIILCGIVIVSATGLSARTSNSKVAVIVGNNAPDLENFAASELCGYLNKLFDIQVQPTTKVSASSDAIFLIGSPASNPLIKSFPQVSDQGIVIQRVAGKTPTLVVGGGSPKATMWAVYELAERWGVHFLTDRDALPKKSAFSLPDLNVKMEPTFRVRAPYTTNVDFADSGEGWGIKDFRRLIDQLAKMKFNRLNLERIRLATVSAVRSGRYQTSDGRSLVRLPLSHHSGHAGPFSFSRGCNRVLEPRFTVARNPG